MTPGSSGFSLLATLPTPAGETGLGPIAGASETVAATAYSVASPTSPTSAYVYAEPPAGWQSSVVPARLTFPDELGYGEQIAATNDLVVVGDGTTTPEGDEEASLFVRPADGWSGSLTPSATLVSTADTSEYDVPGEAPLAVAENTAFIAAGDVVDAFPQPPSGWSGEQQPGATLQIPTGGAITSIAAFDQTAVAAQGSRVYVFREPTGGWSGTTAPVATLKLPTSADSIAMSGSTITVAGESSAFVFTKPAAGWRSTASAARVRPHGFSGDSSGFLETAVRHRTVGMLETVVGGDHSCPCSDSLFALTSSAEHWPARTSVGVPGVEFDGYGGLAAIGTGFAVDNLDGIGLYSATAPPGLRTAQLTNVSGEHPHLELAISRGKGNSSLHRLVVHLPAALHLARGQAPRVLVSSGRARVTRRSDELRMTVRDATGKVLRLRLVGATLAATRRLERRLSVLASRNRAPAVRLRIGVTLTDRAGRTRTATIYLKIV